MYLRKASFKRFLGKVGKWFEKKVTQPILKPVAETALTAAAISAGNAAGAAIVGRRDISIDE